MFLDFHVPSMVKSQIMPYDCPRCWNTGAYYTFEFGYLRCLMCNANFYDHRSGAEIAADLPVSAVPYDTLLGGKSVADLVGGNEFSLRMYDNAIMELEAAHVCKLDN